MKPEPSRAGRAVGERQRPESNQTTDTAKLRALVAELVIAEEQERRRIASGLHDDVGQLLGVAKIKLGEALASEPAAEVAELVSEGRRLVDRAIHEVRALTFELSSPVPQELGLEAALASLAERLEERHGIPCRFRGSPRPLEVSEELAVLLYRIVRELLWNVAKHSRARQAAVAIDREDDRLRIAVEDDGVGFDASRTLGGPAGSGGMGLMSAHERLESLRGSLEIDSHPGRGTRVLLTVPMRR